LRRLYEHDDSSGLNAEHVAKLRVILSRLDVAREPDAMNLPGLRLHALKGERAGFWSVTVRANWRVIFRFQGADAADAITSITIRSPGDDEKPPHPGLSVRLDCLEALGLSVTEAARILGVTRQALNNVVNGKTGISPAMAVRLAKAFGSTAETWLAMQAAYDLAQIRRHEADIQVHRVVLPQPA
jgi:addiction module HigA family antidote